MQLHGTTVTKLFRLTHKVCGYFSLYWSLDAVSALISVLSFNYSDLVLLERKWFSWCPYGHWRRGGLSTYLIPLNIERQM
jgi:hypothetical protein